MSNAATAVPETRLRGRAKNSQTREIISRFMNCLLYTSDAADE